MKWHTQRRFRFTSVYTKTKWKRVFFAYRWTYRWTLISRRKFAPLHICIQGRLPPPCHIGKGGHWGVNILGWNGRGRVLYAIKYGEERKLQLLISLHHKKDGNKQFCNCISRIFCMTNTWVGQTWTFVPPQKNGVSNGRLFHWHRLF